MKKQSLCWTILKLVGFELVERKTEMVDHFFRYKRVPRRHDALFRDIFILTIRYAKTVVVRCRLLATSALSVYPEVDTTTLSSLSAAT
jgi:hypothetical protein